MIFGLWSDTRQKKVSIVNRRAREYVSERLANQDDGENSNMLKEGIEIFLPRGIHMVNDGLAENSSSCAEDNKGMTIETSCQTLCSKPPRMAATDDEVNGSVACWHPRCGI